MSSHITHVGFKELNIVLSHIVKNYPTAVNIYQMIDPAVQDILTDKSELPMIESVQISCWKQELVLLRLGRGKFARSRQIPKIRGNYAATAIQLSNMRKRQAN